MNAPETGVTRRSFVAGAAAGVATLVAAPAAAAGQSLSVRRREAYGIDWSAIRGFNYQPSYGRTGLDIWYNFDAGRIAGELALGKLHFPKINAMRIWLASGAFPGREDVFRRDLESFISSVHRIGCKAMPVLFNRWAGLPEFGDVYLDHFMPGSLRKANFDRRLDPYLAATIGAYRNDPRILAWDLCNEPFITEAALGKPDHTPKIVAQAEINWLRMLYRKARALGPVQPVTIATHGKFPLSKMNEFSDILSAHPYRFPGEPEAEYARKLDAHVAYANSVDKALIASECCWGADDDETHARIIVTELEQLIKRGLGFFPDSLSHSLVADEHRARYGPIGVEMMAFIEADGRLRRGHEVYNRY